jgi:hypothetical protein
MTVLTSRTIEVLLHPSDLVISGRETLAARARAIVAERLAFTPAYLTWDKEPNKLEDRLRAIWEARQHTSRFPTRNGRSSSARCCCSTAPCATSAR